MNRKPSMTPIPSRIFSGLMHLLFIVINGVALYMLFRGHNLPGGGFIAGLLTAISFVLLLMSRGAVRLARLIHLNPFFLVTTGLSLALAVALLPVFLGRPFFNHLAGEIFGVSVSTALLFDMAVYLVVVGTSVKIMYLVRRNIPFVKEVRKR